jgi:dephospho-CoA kinase
VVIIDAPLIYEAGMDTSLRKVIVVWCRPEQQLERLLERPGITREEAERRIKSQMPTEEKLRRADYVVDCSGTLGQSRAQVREVYGKLLELVEGQHD